MGGDGGWVLGGGGIPVLLPRQHTITSPSIYARPPALALCENKTFKTIVLYTGVVHCFCQ
jgi:hypothetical protein